MGDLIVDELVEETPGGQRSATLYAGGAGCNVAVDLVALGTPAILLAEVGEDPAGRALRRSVADRGVDLRPLGDPRPTGWATSSRVDGEPTYTFTGSVCDRRFVVGPAIADGLGRGRLLVVTTFPFHDARQVDDLLAVTTDGGHLLMVDPNPRPQLLGDVEAFRTGFLRVASRASVVKLSEQDHDALGLPPVDVWWADPLAHGAGAVVLTRGASGIRLLRSDHDSIDVPVPSGTAVVDTMGAGDAVAAVIAADVAAAGGPEAPDWRATLERAVRFAARIVAAPGGHSGARPLELDG